MRDLLFKNLTDLNKRRKIISSSEVVEKQGVHRAIHRHFVYIIKEINDDNDAQSLPSVYILKEHNSRLHREKFLCKMKGSIYAYLSGRRYRIIFMHSLRINLTAMPVDIV